MLEKEIEREGIPCVLITSLVPAAITIGANRIVQGNAIIHPLGDINLPYDKERMLRRKLVSEALEFLRRKVDSENRS